MYLLNSLINNFKSNPYPKTLGIILIVVCSQMLFDLVNGIAAGGVVSFLSLFSDTGEVSQNSALLGTILLLLVGFGFAIRALIYNKVCIGGACQIEEK